MCPHVLICLVTVIFVGILQVTGKVSDYECFVHHVFSPSWDDDSYVTDECRAVLHDLADKTAAQAVPIGTGGLPDFGELYEELDLGEDLVDIIDSSASIYGESIAVRFLEELLMMKKSMESMHWEIQ